MKAMAYYGNGNDVQTAALPLKATLHLSPLPFRRSLFSSPHASLHRRLPFPAAAVRSNPDLILLQLLLWRAQARIAHPPPLLRLPCFFLR